MELRYATTEILFQETDAHQLARMKLALKLLIKIPARQQIAATGLLAAVDASILRATVKVVALTVHIILMKHGVFFMFLMAVIISAYQMPAQQNWYVILIFQERLVALIQRYSGFLHLHT